MPSSAMSLWIVVRRLSPFSELLLHLMPLPRPGERTRVTFVAIKRIQRTWNGTVQFIKPHDVFLSVVR